MSGPGTKTLGGALDAAVICQALRDEAARLQIDADALVDRWERRVEVSISAGRSQRDAQQEAYQHELGEARRKRMAIDKLRSKISRGKR